MVIKSMFWNEPFNVKGDRYTCKGDKHTKTVFASLVNWGLFQKLKHKFYPFKIGPFSKGAWCTGKPIGRHKNYVSGTKLCIKSTTYTV